MDKKVSIIIPVYNRVKIVRKAIECSINQTYSNIEIIIGDNCSTDGTWEILQEYAQRDSRIHIFRNEVNLGPVRNWLECIKRANGDFVKILFSDDWMDLDWIEQCYKFFGDKISFVYSPAIVEDANRPVNYDIGKDVIYLSKYDFIKGSIMNASSFPNSPCCALFRKNDLLSSIELKIPNQFNLNHIDNGAGIDKLIFFNVALRNASVVYVPYSKVHFFAHEGSFTCTQDLRLYYASATQYFLKRYNMPLYKKYNSGLLVERSIDYKVEISEVDILYLVKVLAKKIFCKAMSIMTRAQR